MGILSRMYGLKGGLAAIDILLDRPDTGDEMRTSRVEYGYGYEYEHEINQARRFPD